MENGHEILLSLNSSGSMSCLPDLSELCGGSFNAENPGENFPLEFNWLPIQSLKSPENTAHLQSRHLIFPSSNCIVMSVHSSQAEHGVEYSNTLALAHFNCVILTNVDLFHEGLQPSTEMTFRISEFSTIIFLVILNRLSIFSNSEFLNTSKFSSYYNKSKSSKSC